MDLSGWIREEREGDKIKVNVKKQDSGRSTFTEINQDIDADPQEKQFKVENLTENDKYDVTVTFVNGNKEVSSVKTSFTATNNLQITGLNVSDIKSKTAKLSWDYTPNKEFTADTHKVEIYIKDNKAGKSNDDLSDYKNIYYDA